MRVLSFSGLSEQYKHVWFSHSVLDLKKVFLLWWKIWTYQYQNNYCLPTDSQEIKFIANLFQTLGLAISG